MGPETPRAQAALDTRTKLVEAARRCFDKRGYTNTGLRDIAVAACVSTGCIFGHFKTGKDELYRAVYGHLPISPDEGKRLKAEVEALRARLAELEARAA